MILHPPVMALLLVAALGAATLVWSGRFAVRLLRHWDLSSGASRQLEIERRTELVATLVAVVLASQGVALLLTVFNADRTAPLLAGAMCAFGSFNASPYGFPALEVKLALFLLSSVWLAVHLVDVQAPDYPLTRRKYAFLLGLVPLGLADAALSLAYYLDLQPDQLTSCCGTAFKAERPGLGGHAAALDPALSLALLAGAGLLTAAVAWAAGRRRAWAMAYGVQSLLFAGVGLVAVVSAVSIYVYEHPHHHCPFCLLKAEYGYFGFLLYGPLFAGLAAGVASGFLSWRPPVGLADRLVQVSTRLRRLSVSGFALFGLLCALAVLRSGLRL